MHFSNLVLAATAFLTPMVLATPLEERSVPGTWSITNFSFCPTGSTYDYSFHVSGTAIGVTPAFKGLCKGKTGNVYLECEYIPKPQKDFNLFAKTKIGKGSGAPNDILANVDLMTWYIHDGCKYTNAGGEGVYHAKCGKGNSFVPIQPKQTKECN